MNQTNYSNEDRDMQEALAELELELAREQEARRIMDKWARKSKRNQPQPV